MSQTSSTGDGYSLGEPSDLPVDILRLEDVAHELSDTLEVISSQRGMQLVVAVEPHWSF